VTSTVPSGHFDGAVASASLTAWKDRPTSEFGPASDFGTRSETDRTRRLRRVAWTAIPSRDLVLAAEAWWAGASFL